MTDSSLRINGVRQRLNPGLQGKRVFNDEKTQKVTGYIKVALNKYGENLPMFTKGAVDFLPEELSQFLLKNLSNLNLTIEEAPAYIIREILLLHSYGFNGNIHVNEKNAEKKFLLTNAAYEVIKSSHLSTIHHDEEDFGHHSIDWLVKRAIQPMKVGEMARGRLTRHL